MDVLRHVQGWVFILCGLIQAVPLLGRLVRARLSGAGISTIPASEWSALPLALMFLTGGALLGLGYRSDGRLFSVPAALGVVWLTARTTLGIRSRRRAGLSWWRFRTSVKLPATASTAPGIDLVLGAGTLDLIRRIESVVFGTTRFSAGYDEKEVDVFLDKLVADLNEGGQLDREALGRAHFARTWLRSGYLIQDVDNFLQEIATA